MIPAGPIFREAMHDWSTVYPINPTTLCSFIVDHFLLSHRLIFQSWPRFLVERGRPTTWTRTLFSGNLCSKV